MQVGEGEQFVFASTDGAAFEISGGSLDTAARFFMKPSDLGSYLFLDEAEHYLAAIDQELVRTPSLRSDTNDIEDEIVVDDSFVSEGIWALEQDVIEKLDTYYDKGVRAIFPVHKYVQWVFCWRWR